MKSLLITGGRVLDPWESFTVRRYRIFWWRMARISAVGETARLRAETSDIMDASGLLITPGFVNAHCIPTTHCCVACSSKPRLNFGIDRISLSLVARSADEILIRTRLHAVECLRGG